jgi:hypothetical protein
VECHERPPQEQASPPSREPSPCAPTQGPRNTDATAWNKSFRCFRVFKKPFCMARARAVITTWGSRLQRHSMTCPHPNPAPHQANTLGHLPGPRRSNFLGELGCRQQPLASRVWGKKLYKLECSHAGKGLKHIFTTCWLLQRSEIRAGAPNLVIHMPSSA